MKNIDKMGKKGYIIKMCRTVSRPAGFLPDYKKSGSSLIRLRPKNLLPEIPVSGGLKLAVFGRVKDRLTSLMYTKKKKKN